MTLTVEEIKNLPNPYSKLGSSVALIEHRAELNTLSVEDMTLLANKLIEECPQDDLANFGQQIGEFKSSNDDENKFYAIIKIAYFNKASKSETPYQLLGTGDALAEYRDQLNGLDLESKKNLASRMVLECPLQDLSDFHHAIEAGRLPVDDSQTFHFLLTETYEVKHRLVSLFDSRNSKPHLLILGNEFDEELFNNHMDLALQVLNDNESAIAERLALTTPEESRHQVALNVKGIFPNTLFAAKIGQAFAVRRDIDRLLLGNAPYEFFNSREYSTDSCQEFSGLFRIIEGQESSIAGKLALSTPEEKRTTISRNIQGITPTSDELVLKVRTAFALRRDIDRLLLGAKPEQFFASREFSVDNCLEFSMLFPALLKGQEQAIGEKLSLLDQKTRSDINRKLEMINGTAHDQSSPFRLIAAAMVPKQEPTQKPCTSTEAPKVEPVSSSGTNTHSVFNSILKKPDLIQRRTLLKTPTMATSVEDTEKTEDKSCYDQFCGLFKW